MGSAIGGLAAADRLSGLRDRRHSTRTTVSVPIVMPFVVLRLTPASRKRPSVTPILRRPRFVLASRLIFMYALWVPRIATGSAPQKTRSHRISADPPNQPRNVNVRAGNAAFFAAWDAPAGGTAPTHYQLCVLPPTVTETDLATACTSDYQTHSGIKAPATSFFAGGNVAGAVTALANDSAYRVAARSEVRRASDQTVLARSDWVASVPATVTPTAAADGRIDTLTVTGLIGGDITSDNTLDFTPGTLDYYVYTAGDTATTTVTPTLTDTAATFVITSDQDAAIAADGVVDLAGGDNDITITVTAADGSAHYVYRLTVNRATEPLTVAVATDRDTYSEGDDITVTLSRQPTGTAADRHRHHLHAQRKRCRAILRRRRPHAYRNAAGE